MNLDPLLQALIVSASLGALMGLERQWKTQHDNPDQDNLMGVRTFTLWSLFGTLAAYVSTAFVPFFYLIAFGGMAVYLILSSVFDSERRRGFGFTTVTVALLTFIIGSLVFWKQTRVAVTLTICIMILMASKTAIHNWVLRFTREDVKSVLQFAAITGVILPLVPNRAFGPFEAFNPFSIWLMVVLVAGLGFFGYGIMRILGTQKGLGITGTVGGMVSSTATTLALSRQSRVQPELSRSFSLAIVLACLVMLIRVAILVLVVNPMVLLELWPALAVMIVPGGIAAAWWWKDSSHSSSENVLESRLVNPFSLPIAIQFAIIYAIIVFVAKAAAFLYNSAGVFLASFFSGMANVSAIVLSLAQIVNTSSISPEIAAKGILVAVLSGIGVKMSLALILGSPEVRRPLLVSMGATIVCGTLAWWLI